MQRYYLQHRKGSPRALQIRDIQMDTLVSLEVKLGMQSDPRLTHQRRIRGSRSDLQSVLLVR